MSTVATIQARLAELGHSPGPIDGAWGPQTMAAVAAAIGVNAAVPVPVVSDEEPAWLTFARIQLGVREVPGAGNNRSVIDYYAEAAHPEIKRDSVPWCAAFVGAMLKRSGIKPSGSLMARSYISWGQPLEKPRIGCVAVLSRGAPPSGHVAFFISQTATQVKLLGGNQGDAVTIATFRKDSVLAYRWPHNINRA